jgi:hypothetical protein
MYLLLLVFIPSILALTINKPGYYLVESQDPYIKINQGTYRQTVQSYGPSKMMSYFRPGNFKSNIDKIKPIYFPLLPIESSLDGSSWILRQYTQKEIGKIVYFSNNKHAVSFYYNSIGYCDPCWYNLTLSGNGQIYQRSFYQTSAVFEITIPNLEPGEYLWSLLIQNNYNYANVPTAGNGFQQNRNWFGYVTEFKEKDLTKNKNYVKIDSKIFQVIVNSNIESF